VATDLQVERQPVAAVAPPPIAWRKLLGGGTIVVVGSAATNVLSFLFSFVVARLLKPEDYSTVTACLSLLVVVTVPAATLQLVAARYAAIWHESAAMVHTLARWLARIALCLGVLLAVGLVALSAFFTRYLHLPNALPLYLVSGVLLCSFVGPVYRGLLQGLHHFGRYAIASASEFAVRLLAAVSLVLLGWHEAGALGGVLLGAAGGAVLAWSLARQLAGASELKPIPARAIARWAMPTLLVQVALSALVFQDTLLAKHFFSPADAGSYAGLATTARVLFYVSGALSAFLFPVVARMHTHGGQSRLISHLTVGLVALVEVVLVLGFVVAPRFALHLVVGSQYEAVSTYLPAIAVALAAYAVINVLVSYLLATGNRAFLIPLLVAPVAEGLLMTVYHQSLGEFVHTLDAVMLGTLAVMAWIYWRSGAAATTSTWEIE